MRKVIHIVHKSKTNGSRAIVSFEEGDESTPFASRIVEQDEWFNVVRPQWHKHGVLREAVNHGSGLSKWVERVSETEQTLRYVPFLPTGTLRARGKNLWEDK
jgi:hypothetical protein